MFAAGRETPGIPNGHNHSQRAIVARTRGPLDQ
jgi:hypothetical protein